MKEIMTRIPRDDSCPNCHNDRCVELYDAKKKPLRYTLLLDKLETDPQYKSKINLLDLSYFKCTICSNIFKLDWSYNRRIPRPMYIDFLPKLLIEQYFNKLT